MANSNQTGNKAASLAGKVLGSPGASSIQKSLAGSALSQSGTGRQTGNAMEAKASSALKSQSSSSTTKTLAGSVVSQSKK